MARFVFDREITHDITIPLVEIWTIVGPAAHRSTSSSRQIITVQRYEGRRIKRERKKREGLRKKIRSKKIKKSRRRYRAIIVSLVSSTSAKYRSLNEREKEDARTLERERRPTPMGIPSKSRESSFLGDPSASTTTASNDRSIDRSVRYTVTLSFSVTN